jgi:hypothetical protein
MHFLWTNIIIQRYDKFNDNNLADIDNSGLYC